MKRREYIGLLAINGAIFSAGCTEEGTENGGSSGGGSDGSQSNEPIEAPAEDLLPTPSDFDEVGWTAGEIEKDPQQPTEADFATRPFFSDPNVLVFDVWVYDTVGAAKTGYNQRIEERTSDRSVEEVNIGDQGVAYVFGWSIVEFRDANVTGRVSHMDNGKGDISTAKNRAEMLHDIWRN